MEAVLPASALADGWLRVTPNPSPGAVEVRVALPGEGPLSLAIFDVAGKEVVRLHQGPAPAGPLSIGWDGRAGDGRGVPAGLYLVRADRANHTAVQRVVRVR